MKTYFYSLPEQFGQKEHQFSIFTVDLNCLHNLNYGSDKCIGKASVFLLHFCALP